MKISTIFDDDDVMVDAIKKIKTQEGVYITDALTPFPVHGLDKLLDVPPTRMAITSFLYGLTGFGLAVWMTWYMMITDWPQDIGGKPFDNWFYAMPAFVPVMFELTVFCAAHLMVITFFARCGLYPGRKKANPDPSTTDDKFMLEIEISEGKYEQVSELIKSCGGTKITQIKD